MLHRVVRPAMQVLFILLFLCGYLLAFLPQPAQAVTSWYNSGWDYRKELTVYGSTSAAQTNYQKLVRVYAANAGDDMPENLAQYTTGDDGVTSEILTATWRGQSFVAEASATVKKVWLKIVKVGTPGATYTCAITGIAAGVPDETDIKCSGTITGNYVSTTEDWYEFSMGAGAALTSGTSYGIILYSAGGSAGNALKWRSDSSGAYTGGTAFTTPDSGVNWTAVPAVDYLFQICTSTTGTIPLRVDTEGHCQADFDDLRFTKSDGTTLLDYWIENKLTCATDLYADCWVELDTIAQMTSLSEHTHYYLYYGNTTAASVSDGTNTFVQFDNFDSYTAGVDINGKGGWTGTVAGAVVSTDHAYSGANCAKVIGSAGSNAMYRALTATSQSYWIGWRSWKEDAATYYIGTHGNSTNMDAAYITTAEDIYFYDSGGAPIDSTLNTTADTWSKVDVYSEIFASGSFVVRYANNLSATCQMYAAAFNNNVISIQDITSGVGNDTYIDDFFVAKFAVSRPLWGLPGGEETVPLMVIDNVRVFMGYKETGDWLITVRYVNTYAPYYDTYDVKQYFALQLIDSSNVVKASAALPAWGNRVGSIYLSAASVTSLTYGGAYRVRMYGTFTGNPYVDYTLVADDWQGNDLAKLDTWVFTSASVIGTYYSTALTTYMAERGEVLNATGSGIFNNCIGGLSQVRPAIFQIYSNPSEYTPATIGQTYRQELKAWQTNIGPDGTTMLNNLGKIIHVGGDIISVIAFVGMVMLLMTLAYPAGTTPAACALSIPLLGAAIWFGMDWIYIGLLALVAAFLFVKNFWLDKGN